MRRLTTLRKEPEVFLMADSGRLEVVLNDEYRDISVGGRNYHRARRPFPAVGAMAALLIFKLKSGPQENAFQRLPIKRRQSRHRSSNDANLAAFDANPRRTLPRSRGAALIAGFREHFLESPRLRAACDEGAHRFIDRAPCSIGIRAGASHIEGHRMGDVLVAFAPNINRVIDLHRSNASTRPTFNQAGICGAKSAALTGPEASR